ncbi:MULTISPECIES: ABC transporter permease [Acidiphilium]|uniref:Peptide/nickel transport system permease protein n=1 Tax=Acidiphilium rubrum TaxID=526 RepID=A0A8G2FGC7_ACIRU|nr:MULTISPECIES: ABC transporter permease [Acidiphilium]MBW4036845.1 ABC transporter permease [Pseudomonadota bacterium]SIQ69955.1 peptide/nickel transport system permease protein [Acidiphilium rubrum]
MILVMVRRLGEMVFVLVSISVLVFLIFFATPGADPAARLAGRGATPATLAAVRHSFGLDKPLPVQYVLMMKHLFVTQDLTSFVNPGEKVVPAVLQAVPVTLSLVFGAAIIWVIAALVVGVLAAWARDTVLDRLLMLFSLIGVSMPVFWLAEVANLITQARYHDTWLFSWVPALGYVPLSVSVVGWFKSLVIPWTVLAVTYIGLYGRVLRSNLVEAMNEDYIRTARAKGLSERQIILRHALRMSLITLVSMFGLDFGLLAGGGALLIEVVSGLPGVGELTYQALQNLDLPFIMAAVLYGAVFIVVANTVVDMLYAVIDPRAR